MKGRLPIVRLVIFENDQNGNQVKTEREFYADTGTRTYRAINDSGEWYAETEIGGPMEEIIARYRVGEN